LERFLVHESLVEPAVVAEEEALIGRVYHDCIRDEILSFSIEIVEQSPHIVVDRGDGSQIPFMYR